MIPLESVVVPLFVLQSVLALSTSNQIHIFPNIEEPINEDTWEGHIYELSMKSEYSLKHMWWTSFWHNVSFSTRPYGKIRFQGFIQAVLLMSVFGRRLSIRMLYFMKNNHKIIPQGRWGSGGTVSFAAGPWLSPSRGLGSKVPGLFTSGG